MTETERDREIVSRMREYCRDIGETHAYFGASAIVAHQYGMVDRESLWITATEDIPVLQRFCETYLAQ